jgi:predicted AlkP superfamily pyrophosphatase or phosphodiesterase
VLLASALLLVLAPGCATEREPMLPPLTSKDLQADRVLLVSVAGMTPDTYLPTGDAPAPMPMVAALASAGVAAERVIPVSPPTTYPAHAALVSGQPPAANGVVADRLIGERGVRSTHYWHASHLGTPTLWQRVAEAGRPVAALGWPTTLGASIPMLVPDLVPTRLGETWMSVLDDATTPDVYERVGRLGGSDPAADGPGPTRDSVLTGVACELLAQESPPGFLMLRLSGAMPTLASQGAEGPAARKAMALVDSMIAWLVECVDRAGRLDSTDIVVVGDHGTIPIHTGIRVNTVLHRGGMIPDEYWKALARPNGGSAFVYARDEASAVRARSLLAAEAESTRAFRIVSAQEMLELGADPAAWFGLEAIPGFAFVGGTREPVMVATASRVAGGYLFQDARMSGGFVAWGPGLRTGIRVPVLRQIDVAPTLARLLGVSLGDIDGRELVGALGAPGRIGP